MNITLAEAMHKVRSLEAIIDHLEKDFPADTYKEQIREYLEEYVDILLDMKVKI